MSGMSVEDPDHPPHPHIPRMTVSAHFFLSLSFLSYTSLGISSGISSYLININIKVISSVSITVTILPLHYNISFKLIVYT